MFKDKREFITLALLVAMFAVSFYVMPMLPDKIATHWNADGVVDGHSSPDGIFLLPLISLGIYALFTFLPKIAVKQKNILDFYAKHGFGYKFAFILVMAAIQSIIILTAFGKSVEMNTCMPILLGALFIYIGHTMKDIKRNYFIGFRTPWALANDKNWNKTHTFGSKAFMLSGLVAIAVGIFGLPIWYWIFPLFALIAATFIYSYREFQK